MRSTIRNVGADTRRLTRFRAVHLVGRPSSGLRGLLLLTLICRFPFTHHRKFRNAVPLRRKARRSASPLGQRYLVVRSIRRALTPSRGFVNRLTVRAFSPVIRRFTLTFSQGIAGLKSRILVPHGQLRRPSISSASIAKSFSFVKIRVPRWVL